MMVVFQLFVWVMLLERKVISMAVVPQPTTYYIMVFGNNYATFHYIPTEEEYNDGVRAQLAFDHDLLKAERLNKDDMLDVVGEFGGTVYECSETYTDVTNNLPARTTTPTSEVQSVSDGSTTASSEPQQAQASRLL